MRNKVRESQLWNWLKQGPGYMRRIEDCLAAGTPDVIGVYQSRAFVTELKVAQKRSHDTVWCGLRSEQASVLRQWAAAGGSAWILIQVDNSERYLVSAENCLELLQVVSIARLSELSVCPPDAQPKIIVEKMGGK